MKYTPLPPIEGKTACLTCGCGSHDLLSMEQLLAVGFGDCSVTKDGECVYREILVGDGGQFWQGKDAEAAAAKDPDHDWRVVFFAALYEAEYQRQGDGHWPLVRRGDGFA